MVPFRAGLAEHLTTPVPDIRVEWLETRQMLVLANPKETAAQQERLNKEQTDEWLIAKRYMSVESLKIPALTMVSPDDPRPAMDAALEAAAG
jgi:hypothetical protein